MAKKKTRTPKKKKPRSPSLPKEPLFVGLDDPVELRKHILEPTREVIQFLQSYEEFKKTKEEKTQALLQLRGELKNIRTSFNRLRRLFPRNKAKAEKTCQKIKKEIKKERKLPSASLPEEAPAIPNRKSFPELDSLERELGEIEKKLDTLS